MVRGFSNTVREVEVTLRLCVVDPDSESLPHEEEDPRVTSYAAAEFGV